MTMMSTSTPGHLETRCFSTFKIQKQRVPDLQYKTPSFSITQSVGFLAAYFIPRNIRKEYGSCQVQQFHVKHRQITLDGKFLCLQSTLLLKYITQSQGQGEDMLNISFSSCLIHVCHLFHHVANHAIYPLMPTRRIYFQVYLSTDSLVLWQHSWYSLVFKGVCHSFIPRNVAAMQIKRLWRTVKSSEINCLIDVLISIQCLQKQPRQPAYTHLLLFTCLKSYEINPAPRPKLYG